LFASDVDEGVAEAAAAEVPLMHAPKVLVTYHNKTSRPAEGENSATARKMPSGKMDTG
jgi:hypothetical protein